MSLPDSGHDPVLLREVLDQLQPSAGKTFVDCTLGRAGHARAIAEHLGSDGTLICLDADPRNLAVAQKFLESAPCRCRIFHANFSELPDVMREAGIEKFDGLLADLGISTNQLFESDYGMSFSIDMPLDMRLDPRDRQSAADLVNNLPETDLANVLYELAQERYSRRIARKIVEARRISPITSTERLAELVRSVIPTRHGSRDKIDPATRTFMALRMSVNRELDNLAALLNNGPKYLAPGGRMGIISFHSTEDRLVKNAFRQQVELGLAQAITRKPITPSDAELTANPRSRSAKLRVIQKPIA